MSNPEQREIASNDRALTGKVSFPYSFVRTRVLILSLPFLGVAHIKPESVFPFFLLLHPSPLR
jgi:hypothetical protein